LLIQNQTQETSMDGRGNIVRTVIILAGLVSLAVASILCVGLLFGWILNWMIPSVDFGIALVASLIAFAIVAAGFLYLSSRFRVFDAADSIDEEEDGEVELSEWQIVELVERFSEAVNLRTEIPAVTSRGKRRR
jgi:hypothetical protein